MCVCVFVRAVVYVLVCLFVRAVLFACNPRQLGRAKSGEKPTSISFLGLSERCQYLHSGGYRLLRVRRTVEHRSEWPRWPRIGKQTNKQTAEEEYPLPYCRMRAA